MNFFWCNVCRHSLCRAVSIMGKLEVYDWCVHFLGFLSSCSCSMLAFKQDLYFCPKTFSYWLYWWCLMLRWGALTFIRCYQIFSSGKSLTCTWSASSPLITSLCESDYFIEGARTKWKGISMKPFRYSCFSCRPAEIVRGLHVVFNISYWFSLL